jgi:RES domain
MTATPWQPAWFDVAKPRQMQAWRGVEAQHIVSTMRLVDTLDEQSVLERILESSKPPLPAAGVAKHYLLATPFRYRPRHASRFRAIGARGVWYGARSIKTVCAELAYWRWRFLMDSAGLAQEELLTEHTLFRATVSGLAIDLMAPPWVGNRAAWTHPGDYTPTQALAVAAHERRLQWIRYESVRDPGGVCAAVLDVAALDKLDLAGQQTWHCRATRQAVRLIRGSERYEWVF